MTEIIDFKLSENYSFYQLTDSDSYPDLVEENRRIVDDQPIICGSGYLENLTMLCENVLEKIYEESGELPQVLSGFRYGRLNRAVGGSWNSLHKSGKAVDFTLWNYDIRMMFHKIIEEPLFNFHKVIYYFDRHFIHVSLPTGSGDNIALIKQAGKFKIVR